jgi:sialidase-1
MGPSHGIQLANGPLAGALVAPGHHRVRADGRSGGHLLVSQDGGATWAIGASEDASPEVGPGEMSGVELGDGGLYLGTRRSVADDITLAERATGLRGEARLGPALDFEPAPAFRRNPVFRGPAVHGSLARAAGSPRFGDRARVLFTFPAGEHGTTFSEFRHDLRVYSSHDEAATFLPGVRLVGERAAYSDTLVLPDGRAAFLFENARSGEGAYARVDFLSAPLQALDDKTVASWTFEDEAGPAALGATASAGLHALPLQPQGTVGLVAGAHHSTAAHFETSRACVAETALRRLADLGIRDGFEVEVSFRTTAHASGGAEAAGALIAKTVVGTTPAWWLRVEDGRLRWFVVDSNGASATLLSDVAVSDGAYHTVRAGRDAAGGRITLSVDGVTTTAPLAATGFIANGAPLCLGAFGDGARALDGDIDAARFSLTD